MIESKATSLTAVIQLANRPRFSSRRDFLPHDDWLIKGFDMSNFVSQVVIEQSNQEFEHDEDHMASASTDNTLLEDDDSEEEEERVVGMSRAQQLSRL